MSLLLNQNNFYELALGQRYGLNPETSQRNGWFTINDREGRISFSNDLKGKLVLDQTVTNSETSISVSHLDPGMYIVQIENEGVLTRERIIKQ